MKPASQYRRSVVVIEDDPLNLELMQTVLEGGGYRVLTASNARSGIALVKQELPAAILMDVQLPEMDGLEATRVLRADVATAAIPVVAVTAHVKKDDEARCLEAGCVLHVPKPVDTRRLIEIVAGVIATATGEAPEQALEKAPEKAPEISPVPKLTKKPNPGAPREGRNA